MTGVLTWTNPLWGWALLAAVGVPLLAHLFSQRGGRLVVFPSIRFIQQALDEGRRRVRLRDWLLFALRALALAVLVATLAGPVWDSRATATARAGVTTIFLLDRSASMNRSDAGVPLVDIARRQIDRALANLDAARDRANIVLIDRSPRALLPEPTANLAMLRDVLAHVEPTYERGDLDAAISLAVAQSRLRAPDDRRGPRPRSTALELFSDMQATQHADAARDLNGAALHLHPLGKPAPNLALLRPGVASGLSLIDVPATLQVDVANFGDGPTTATVSLTLDPFQPDPHTDRKDVRVPAGGATTVSFDVIQHGFGERLARFDLKSEDDAIEADNHIGLIDHVPVQYDDGPITDQDVNNPLFPAYYLARAISPDAEKYAAMPRDRVARWTRDELLPRHEPKVHVIVGLKSLGSGAASGLKEAMQRGDGVLWIVDDLGSALDLQGLRGDDGSPLSPMTFDPRTLGQGGPHKLGSGQFQSPILDLFNGSARRQLLDQQFAKTTRGTLAPDAETLLWFDDGSPALVARWVGAGRIAVLLADVSPANSGLAKSPVFVPLVQQLLRHLVPGPPPPAVAYPGDSPVLALSERLEQREIEVFGPDGKPHDFHLSQGLGTTNVALGRVKMPGFYRAVATPLHVGGLVRGGETFGGIWIGIDPSESDLRTAVTRGTLNEEAAGVGESQVTVVRDRPVELWPWLVLAAVAVVLVEQLILVGGKWAATRRETPAQEVAA